jgi:PRTRC genetic system protein C
MYQLENMPRRFTFTIEGKEKDLPDIGADKTPQEVIKFYADLYPELTNVEFEGPTIVKGVAEYKTKASMGRKG